MDEEVSIKYVTLYRVGVIYMDHFGPVLFVKIVGSVNIAVENHRSHVVIC